MALPSSYTVDYFFGDGVVLYSYLAGLVGGSSGRDLYLYLDLDSRAYSGVVCCVVL